jgi:hypothetical protein
MGKSIRKSALRPDHGPSSLGELIHAWVRRAIETAVHEELAATLGAALRAPRESAIAMA